MKNISKKMVLGALVMGLFSTSAMAFDFNSYAYGGSPAEAQREARATAILHCSTRGGVWNIKFGGLIKIGDGNYKIKYYGFCKD